MSTRRTAIVEQQREHARTETGPRHLRPQIPAWRRHASLVDSTAPPPSSSRSLRPGFASRPNLRPSQPSPRHPTSLMHADVLAGRSIVAPESPPRHQEPPDRPLDIHIMNRRMASTDRPQSRQQAIVTLPVGGQTDPLARTEAMATHRSREPHTQPNQSQRASRAWSPTQSSCSSKPRARSVPVAQV